jgi:hypothetical protein
MSTNGQLVFTDVDKITFKGVGDASNAVIDTLTGKIGVGVDSPDANLHVVGNSYVSTNLELGGTLIMGTVNVEAQHSLEAVTATGNITPLTLEFTNPTTSLVASGNVEVGGNVVAGYLYGDGSNISGISSNLDQIVNIGNVTSNTVQFTNATTGLVATANVEVGGELTVSGNVVVDTNTLKIDATNNRVGIGTTNPATNLHLVGVGNDSGPRLRFETLNNGNDQYTVSEKEIGGIQFGADDYGWTTQHMSSEIVGIHYNPDYPGAQGILAFKTSTNAGSSPTEKMRIRYDGNVGIGTNNPSYPLDISGHVASGPPSGVWGYYVSTTEATSVGNPWNTYNQNISQRVSQNIIAQKFQTYSDRRIKKNIIEIRDDEALIKLRNLQPCKYNYIDNVKGGSRDVYGFIAQEVGSILPDAVGTHTSCIPNIYELANVSDSNVITFTNFDTSNLESNAMVLKVYDVNDTEHLVNITEVIDEHSVRVEEDLSEWTGSVDETGNVVSGNQLFVYGQEVDDFFYLDKNAIWTVATSALQEVDHQLQAEKVKVITLETQLASVLTRLDALENA